METRITTLFIGLLITLTITAEAQRPNTRTDIRIGHNAISQVHGQRGHGQYDRDGYNFDRILRRQLRRGVINGRQYRQLNRELEYIRLMEEMALLDGRISRRENRLIRRTKDRFYNQLTRGRGNGPRP